MEEPGPWWLEVGLPLFFLWGGSGTGIATGIFSVMALNPPYSTVIWLIWVVLATITTVVPWVYLNRTYNERWSVYLDDLRTHEQQRGFEPPHRGQT